MMHPRQFFRDAFSMIALLMVLGIVHPYHLAGEEASLELASHPATQYPFAALYTLIIVWMAPRFNVYLRLFRRIWFLWLFVGLSCASILWSVAPEFTLRRGIALVGTTLLGCFLHARHDLKKQIELLCWTTAILGVLSLLAVLFFPDVGIMGEEMGYGWCGVVPHKNTLGIVEGLSILCFLLAMPETGAGHRLSALGISLATLLLWKSDSRTSQLVCAVTVLAYPFFRLIQGQSSKRAALASVLMLALFSGTILALVTHLENVLPHVGRNVTLTGRTEVWAAAARQIMLRPLLGYGYSTFWAWRNSTYYLPGFEAMAAHSGYLDLLLDTGGVGFILFMAGFAVVYIRALLYARAHTNRVALWPLLFLTWLALHNLGESTLESRNSVHWTLFVATALTVSAREDDPEASAGVARPPT